MRVGSCRYSSHTRRPLLLASAALACALIALTCPSVADAACAANEFCVNYTFHNSTQDDDSDTMTWSATTVANGVNRAIVVGVAIRYTGSGSIPNVSTVTFDGIDLELLDSVTATDDGKRAEIWGLAGDSNVSTGTNEVLVTLTDNAAIIGGAVTFTGVDPDTPFNATSTRSTDEYILRLFAPG